eukprot:gene13246-15653_t
MFAEDMPEVPTNSGDSPSEGDDSGRPVGAATSRLSAPEVSESPINTHASADEQMPTPDNDLNFTQQMMAVEDQDLKSVVNHNDAAAITHVSSSTTVDAQLSVSDSHPLDKDHVGDSHPLDDDGLGGSHPLNDDEEDDDDSLKCERVSSDGLKEAGVVLDDKSDVPKTLLAAMDTSNIFEEGRPSKSYSAWHAEQEAYLHAVDILQIAEKAMEATLAFKRRGKYLSPKTLDKRLTSKVTGVSDKVAKVSSRAQDTQTTQQKSGEMERILRRSTRSQVLRAKEGVKPPLLAGCHLGGR